MFIYSDYHIFFCKITAAITILLLGYVKHIDISAGVCKKGEKFTSEETASEMELRAVTQSPEAVAINNQTLYKLKIHKPALDNPTYWHKFTINDVHGLKRNSVLKIILEHVKPLDLIPLGYTQEGKGAFFFGRICGKTIEKLCHDNLTIPTSDKPFKLQLVLKYSSTKAVKVDLSENVMKVLRKRFKTGLLNLNRFCDDPGLLEFFPLSQPRLLAFVLNLARIFKLKSLNLCNNEIKTLDAMRILAPQTISSVDLRNNSIRDLVELKHLDSFGVTELWLEGNPLCELYDGYSYVQQAVQHCPKIEKLDGFLMRQNGVPSFRRNFLCDMSAHSVVDQFLEKYFTTYDTRNLISLERFYHEEALFSMTSPNSQLTTYRVYSRNLRFLVGSQELKNLCVGRQAIMDLFKKLPHAEHDPYSFTVDVLQYSGKSAIVVVTGVFREVPAVEKLQGFNRCFVLDCRDGVYRITNEQLHVFKALSSQEVTAFKRPTGLQQAASPTQRNQMINTFAVITNLTKDWAKLFLEECHYNMKHAMVLFVDLYKCDKIPLKGFNEE